MSSGSEQFGKGGGSSLKGRTAASMRKQRAKYHAQALAKGDVPF